MYILSNWFCEIRLLIIGFCVQNEIKIHSHRNAHCENDVKSLIRFGKYRAWSLQYTHFGGTLTDRRYFSYRCHVIVALKLWCMIIYVSYGNVDIANGCEYTIVGLRINDKRYGMNTKEEKTKYTHSTK